MQVLGLIIRIKEFFKAKRLKIEFIALKESLLPFVHFMSHTGTCLCTALVPSARYHCLARLQFRNKKFVHIL